MKGIIFAIIYTFSTVVYSGYELNWTPPTENTDGTPLTDLAGYDVWCIPESSTYGNPLIIDDPQQVRLVKDWASPAGPWKCKMRAFNTAGQRSADSTEVLWTCVDPDGDGNCDVLKPLAPDPDNPGAGLVVRSNAMEITRKGYYTITSPDGDELLKPDGTPRRCTSRDECYEYITKDGRAGAFYINQPPYEIKYE